MNLKNHYDLYFFSIELRDFYTINTESDNEYWQTWYCWNKDCWCWDYEVLQWYKKENITKVPLYKRITFRYDYSILSLIISYILWIVTYYLLK